MNRRDFLKSAFALAAAPAIIPASAIGKAIRPAANSRVNMGFIGTGIRGIQNLQGLMTDPRVQVVSVCDVDANHLAKALKLAEDKYGKGTVAAVKDFREITRNPAIDAVAVSTPDHWHAIPTLDAMRHGKDAYTEKPLTHTIAEGRLLSDEARRYGRIVQTGSQQRSVGEFRRFADLVRNGYIGELKRIDVLIPRNSRQAPDSWSPQEPPPELDYNMWLGPAPWAPYHPDRCHYSFRFISDYGGGQVTNWGAHYLDIAQWTMGMDNSGPVRVEGHGVFPESGLFNAAVKTDFTCTYASGIEVRCTTRSDNRNDGNIRYEGTDGWISLRRDTMDASDRRLLEQHVAATEESLPFTGVDHFTNFIDCVISRHQPIAHVEAGHRSATVCHLGNIAMRLGRPLEWDPEKEKFKKDDDANRALSRPDRQTWA